MPATIEQIRSHLDARKVVYYLHPDNEAVLKTSLRGLGKPGEHHHVAPVHPEYANIGYMKQDIAKAKALMSAAGSKGFNVDLSSYHRDDIDALAPFLKASLAEIGINVTFLTVREADFSDGR
mgnify:CR=1 FL=1